jgi:hypothetical protein
LETLIRLYEMTLDPLRLEQARTKIKAAIACLESLRGSLADAAPPSRRGRKSMTEAESRQVSERKKEYWAKRRRNKSGNRGGLLA